MEINVYSGDMVELGMKGFKLYDIVILGANTILRLADMRDSGEYTDKEYTTLVDEKYCIANITKHKTDDVNILHLISANNESQLCFREDDAKKGDILLIFREGTDFFKDFENKD